MNPDPDYDPEPAGQSEYDAMWGDRAAEPPPEPPTDAEIADMARRAGLDGDPFAEPVSHIVPAPDTAPPASRFPAAEYDLGGSD